MKVALIGATGYVGSHILKELLDRGHDVTAILRNPEKLKLQHANLTVKKGDVLDKEQVTALVKGSDAVISAYNPGWKNPNIFNEFLHGSTSILDGTKEAEVGRLLVVGGAGSLDVVPGVQLVDTPDFPNEWKSGALAARDFLSVLHEETIQDWTFLSPSIKMVPGERTGKFRLGTDYIIFDSNKESKISVQDYAVAMVDELEKHQHSRKRFTVGY